MVMYRQKLDGTWGPSQSMYQGKEYDLELYKNGTWFLYWRQHFITKGYSTTRLGRAIRVYFAIFWFHLKGSFGKVEK